MVLELSIILVIIARDTFFILFVLSSQYKPSNGMNNILNNPQLG